MLHPDPQRYLMPVELDRMRVLCFDQRATFAVYQRYGANFWRELFEHDPNAAPDKKGNRPVRLRSLEAFEFFLWAGLQRDADEAGETLTLQDVQEQIVPSTISDLFNALLVAMSATRRRRVKGDLGNVPAGEAAKPVVQ